MTDIYSSISIKPHCLLGHFWPHINLWSWQGDKFLVPTSGPEHSELKWTVISVNHSLHLSNDVVFAAVSLQERIDFSLSCVTLTVEATNHQTVPFMLFKGEVI